MRAGRPSLPFWPRFLDRVNKTESCWIWTGFKDKGGYGVLRRNGSSVRAHRAILELKLARKISHGMLACHTCNNPSCVNPEHIYEGSPKENTADMFKAGRHASQFKTDWKCYATGADHHWTKDPTHAVGENNGRAKLSEPEVISIISRLASGEKRSIIAKEFNVTWTTIANIGNGKLWKHIKRSGKNV